MKNNRRKPNKKPDGGAPPMTMSAIQYFIVTEALESCNAGCLCYSLDYQDGSKHTGYPTKLQVFLLGVHRQACCEIDARCLKELSKDKAGLLQALSDDSEKLRWFKDENALRIALTLSEGSEVVVEEGREKLLGIIRYIGNLPQLMETTEPLPGVFFGVELQGDDKAKGYTDGSWLGQTLFSCDKNSGLFVPFSKVRRRFSESVPQSSSAPETQQPVPGDRVTYCIEDHCLYGMVVNVHQKDGTCFVLISTDSDASGKTSEIEVPVQFVVKGELPCGWNLESKLIDVDTSAVDQKCGLDVNSLVEVSLAAGNAYGIIRWIGNLPGRRHVMAGLELEEDMGLSDGTFKNMCLFRCPPGRALFVKFSSCHPDARFLSDGDKNMTPKDDVAGELSDREGQRSIAKMEPIPPISADQVHKVLIGRMKGIQGHHNSCYIDAALFSLFSCSSVLDSMLFKSTPPQDGAIQTTLLHDIVTPLRSEGFVEGGHVMKLRQQLQKHGCSNSFTTDEKDPEEFLTVIMHHILALDPLLKLSAGGEVQESYCYQIFLEQNHKLVLPTVQQLLEHSFHSAGLKLAEVPPCLILQMPRFGKKFKMFEKIIPSLELDITNLLSEGPQQCILCGKLAQEECLDCFEEPVFGCTGCKIFCSTCSAQRRSHQTAALNIPKGYMEQAAANNGSRDIMELFAVLCIETSHYVSFLKYGPDSKDWIFFDSMADRSGGTDGFNIPEVRACPEVGVYLDMSPAELANQVPRNMSGVAKRLFCDAYMYLYQSTRMGLYH
ncbi:ubiquitin carboxyl-terminal hydrolase CYLD isoform X2 [Nerophis lumbriciformis]|uniref:ubiquitin carboxyl-terminal hydrolase CYLD isoform X2 n=1 Tax=Nerophis lumbriciformis TaxID=546530 RepID=UPI002ADFC71D|nr:ubiquitin carboxyl-terminal hydrolase CYLD-like isoform X2 [Nerophis lumbriciformis]